MSKAYQIILTANRAEMRQRLTLPPRANDVDRSLDLLVINQGHGHWTTFSGWSVGELQANVVEPLVRSGVTASILVLDFRLSASLLSAFVALCSNPGRVVCSIYSTTALVVITELWKEIRGALHDRDTNAIWRAVMARLSILAAIDTGMAHLETVREASEPRIGNWLAGHPVDRDAISIIRYLPRIKDALAPAGLTPNERYQALLALWQNPNLGYQERTVLQPINTTPVSADWLTQIQEGLNARVRQILTQPPYRIQLADAALQGVPLFAPDGPSLWSMLTDHRPLLLSLAQGFERCPTAFAVYDVQAGRLELDAALNVDPVRQATATLLDTVRPGTALEVTRMIRDLTNQNVVGEFAWRPDFLQS